MIPRLLVTVLAGGISLYQSHATKISTHITMKDRRHRQTARKLYEAIIHHIDGTVERSVKVTHKQIEGALLDGQSVYIPSLDIGSAPAELFLTDNTVYIRSGIKAPCVF